MARFIPNPAGDLLKRIDRTLESVDPVLGRVDVTLSTVEATLTTVEGTLADATAVLTDVRGLLVEFQDELQLLHQVPAMVARLDEIHAAVTAKP